MSVCVVVVVLTSTFRCPEVGLDFLLLGVQSYLGDATSYFCLVALSANSREELVVVCSACRFQLATSTSRCPEVGFEFLLLGVQRLDSNFHF